MSRVAKTICSATCDLRPAPCVERSYTMTQNAALAPGVSRFQRIALIAGVVALLLCAVGAFLDPAAFFQAYLVAFLYWLGFPLGALAIVALYHLGGGVWGFPIRRPLEAAMVTLPLLAVLLVPLI